MDILFLLFGFVLIILVSIFMEKSFEVLNIEGKVRKHLKPLPTKETFGMLFRKHSVTVE